jgi:stage V sporulation protein D (sporulation-specific penicillin-binding protein)
VERKLTKEEKKAALKNTVEVPDVTGMDSKDAIRNIKLYGLTYAIIPEDHSIQSFVVVDQYPKAGTRIEKGSVVYIYSE